MEKGMPEATLQQTDTSPREIRWAKSKYTWFVLGIVLLQWLLFRSYVLREIAWAYPTNSDQLTYLRRSYEGYESLLASNTISQGISLWIGSVAKNSPYGIMLPIQASLLFLLFGASRLTALSLNFIYYIAWQCSNIIAVRYVSGQWRAAMIAWGSSLAIGTPFTLAGGAMDFRLDFIAFCLLGVFVSVVIVADILGDTKWSIMAGVVGGLLILFRYLTAAYLLGIYALTLLFCWVVFTKSATDSERRSTYGLRIKNIFLSGMIITGIDGPFLWVSRATIYQYYLSSSIDHSVWASADPLFYLKSVLFRHLGEGFIVVSILLLLISLLISLSTLRKNAGTQNPSYNFDLDLSASVMFLLACFIVPFCLLAGYTAKSEVVSSIMVPPIYWLVMLAILFLLKRADFSQRHRVASLFLWVMVILSLGYGFYHQLNAYSRHTALSLRRQDVLQVVKMYDDIGAHSEKMGWQNPRISVDNIKDYLAGGSVLTPLYYERHGVFLKVQTKLGVSISHVNEQQALQALGDSDFVILTYTNQPGYGYKPTYPFVTDFEQIRPMVNEFVQQEFGLLGSYQIYGQDVDVYVRPSFTIAGLSADHWLTSEGMTLYVPVILAEPSAKLLLKGMSPDLAWLPPDTQVSAKLVEPGGKGRSLVTDFRATGQDYSIQITLPAELPDLDKEQMLRIKVSFSSYFIPSELGINEDTRQLVIQAPTETRILQP
jgi:hypothetical protein